MLFVICKYNSLAYPEMNVAFGGGGTVSIQDGILRCTRNLRWQIEPCQMLSRHLEFHLEFTNFFSPNSIKRCLTHV